MTIEPVVGKGSFQWNKGGWFGGQIGCTAWMLLGSIGLLLGGAPAIGTFWLSCCIGVNLLGCYLWNRRDRIEPYHALQGFITTAIVTGLLMIVVLQYFEPRVSESVRGGQPFRSIYAGFASLWFFLTLQFAFLEWVGRRRTSVRNG